MKTTKQQQQQHPSPITINGSDLKEFTSFTYLALSIVSTTHSRNRRECQIENREGEKHIHQPETNLEISVTQPASTTKFGRIFNTNKRQVSQFFSTIRNLVGGSQRIFPIACCRPLSTTIVFTLY
uniref:Uncharacterized protein n=1 Tax=Trichobilharzia regenti TaxID=157069 RepID=A0AA85JA00_TRIRE|nr:unnamed protein product [Trichobilharzia regenti]